MQDVYLGYDPGGGGAHGVACISGSLLKCAVVDTAASAIRWFRAACAVATPRAIGVDTLTLWSTGPAGWRPADRALRAAYPEVANSVVAPNSLYGAMPINGAAAVVLLLQTYPDLLVTETHPKVLHFALTGNVWDFSSAPVEMNAYLTKCVGSECQPNSEHEWDAAISAYAARELATGTWSTNLHAAPPQQFEELVPFHSRPHYAWPTPVATSAATPNSPGRAPAARRERWAAAVEMLTARGHEDVARQVADYRNARGQRSGWDTWFKAQFPALAQLLE